MKTLLTFLTLLLSLFAAAQPFTIEQRETLNADSISAHPVIVLTATRYVPIRSSKAPQRVATFGVFSVILSVKKTAIPAPVTGVQFWNQPYTVSSQIANFRSLDGPVQIRDYSSPWGIVLSDYKPYRNTEHYPNATDDGYCYFTLIGTSKNLPWRFVPGQEVALCEFDMPRGWIGQVVIVHPQARMPWTLLPAVGIGTSPYLGIAEDLVTGRPQSAKNAIRYIKRR